MGAAQPMVDLHAEFVRLFFRGATRRQEVVRHVAKRSRHEACPIRHHRRSRERQVLLRDRTEPVRRNPVAGEGISDEAGSVRVGSCGRRVVNDQQSTLAVHPVGKITVVHLRRRNAERQRVRCLVVHEAFVSGEEERLVLSGVHARDLNRPAQRRAEIVLAIDAFGRLEKSFLVQRIVAEKVVDRAVEFVRSRLRGKGNGAAACLAELGLEAVGLDRELGNGLDRRRQERCFDDVGVAIGVHRNAVERGTERPALAAAEGHIRAAALRFRHRGHEVEDAAHRATHHQRELVDQLVGNIRGDLGVVSLHQRVPSGDVHRFADRAESKEDVDSCRRAGDQRDSFHVRSLEPLKSGLDAIRAGRQVEGSYRCPPPP